MSDEPGWGIGKVPESRCPRRGRPNCPKISIKKIIHSEAFCFSRIALQLRPSLAAQRYRDSRSTALLLTRATNAFDFDKLCSWNCFDRCYVKYSFFPFKCVYFCKGVFTILLSFTPRTSSTSDWAVGFLLNCWPKKASCSSFHSVLV